MSIKYFTSIIPIGQKQGKIADFKQKGNFHTIIHTYIHTHTIICVLPSATSLFRNFLKRHRKSES